MGIEPPCAGSLMRNMSAQKYHILIIPHGLPDIYTLSPLACGPQASGVYIKQTTRAHGITITYSYIWQENPE